VKVGGGLLMRRSGFWTLHVCYSTDVTIDGVVDPQQRGRPRAIHRRHRYRLLEDASWCRTPTSPSTTTRCA
jgi:hypothetical protein